uniref:C2H2-type domain-containing protein n=1 Tax=Maylandia zebra TaxID=106582 RepID=A0A3P9DRP4_9CICH
MCLFRFSTFSVRIWKIRQSWTKLPLGLLSLGFYIKFILKKICRPNAAVAFKHSVIRIKKKTHTCNICGKSFLTVVGYRGHLARHKGNTPYKCRTCHKAFPEKWVLKNHESRVHAPHSCNVCGKRFRHLDTLSQHVNHSRERLFACDKCNKKFFHKSNVVTHMRVHTGEKPYKCTHCGKGFSQGHCVRRHLLIHQKKYHQQTEQLSRVETEDSYAKVDSISDPEGERCASPSIPTDLWGKLAYRFLDS